MVRVAVIGVGAPWHHLPALSALPNAAVVALCDIDEARLQDAGQTYGVRDLYAALELPGGNWPWPRAAAPAPRAKTAVAS